MNETDEMMQLFPAWREAAKKFLEEGNTNQLGSVNGHYCGMTDKESTTLLAYAALYGKNELVTTREVCGRFLLSKKADLDKFSSPKGLWSPLNLAACTTQLDTLKTTLQNCFSRALVQLLFRTNNNWKRFSGKKI